MIKPKQLPGLLFTRLVPAILTLSGILLVTGPAPLYAETDSTKAAIPTQAVPAAELKSVTAIPVDSAAPPIAANTKPEDSNTVTEQTPIETSEQTNPDATVSDSGAAVPPIPAVTNSTVTEETHSTSTDSPSVKAATVPDKNSIGVLYFKNAGTDSMYKPLEAALADMVITDLSQVASLKIIERSRMSALIMEKEFQLTDYAAGSDTAKLSTGQVLQVEKTLVGRFKVNEQKELAIKTALVATTDNSPNPSGKAKGPVEKFFELEKQLVFSVIDNMGIKLSEEERKKIQVIKTENLLALLAYGTGLMAEDQGDFAAAAAAYSKAAKLDPTFTQAGQMAKTAASMGAQTPAGTEKTPVAVSGGGVQSISEKLVEEGKKEMGEDMSQEQSLRTKETSESPPSTTPTTAKTPQVKEPAATKTTFSATRPVAVRVSNFVGGSFMPEAAEITTNNYESQENPAASSSQATTGTPGATTGISEAHNSGITSIAPRNVEVKIPIPDLNN
ncbi:MAG: hypothetical protein HQK83_00420 [Fibrobacteria bacterium]|nr:hypothetical protein [Fibrobacteria bacterium]